MKSSPDGASVGIRSGRPLGRIQEQIWASQRLHPDAPLANMAYRISIDGALDPDRFRSAFEQVVRSADALRTVIPTDTGAPGLRILAEPPAGTEVRELDRDLVAPWCTDRIARPLDPSTCPYDSVLLRHGDAAWTWWLDLHHVITDAVSSALVVEATAAAYAGAPLLVGGSADSTAMGAGPRQDQRRARALERWSNVGPKAPDLTPYGPLGPATTRCDRRPLALSDGERTTLEEGLDGPYRAISRELGLLALLATVVAVWVHRTDGRREMTLGMPVHHRTGPRASGGGSAQEIGSLMELFSLDVTIEDGDTFGSLHGRVLRSALDVLRHAVPGTSPDQQFNVVLNVLTVRYGDFAGFPLEAEWVPSGHADPAHLIRVQAHDHTGAGPRLDIDVNHALGPDRVRDRIPGHLRSVLVAALDDPHAAIGSVLLPGVDERVEIARLNDDRPAGDPRAPADVQIREVLRHTPDRVVVEEGPRRLSAGELDARSDALARYLADRGIGVGDRVGLRLPRGTDAVIAVQGVLRSGAAFVPLDPADPRQRHDLIAADASLALVLDELPDLPRSTDPRPTSLDPGPSNNEARPLDDGPSPDEVRSLDAGRSLDDIAYILYTSGSTGVPKGVPVSHRGLAGYLEAALEAYVRPEAPPTAALHSSLVFDLTITTLFLPLLSGGSMVVFPGEPVEALAAVGLDERIDFLKVTPSQLELFLQLTDDPSGIEVMIVGGEAFRRPLALAATRAGGPGLRIYNEYGPTEAVVGCMIHCFEPDTDLGADVPIGRSYPDCEVFILDAYDQFAPEGAWGELVVRRPGMASSYLGHGSAGPFGVVEGIGGAPLYRTGDRARIERPGIAVYGGRLDHQLKIGGVRFEPGEIEAALVSHPDVANALVRIWRPGAHGRAPVRCERCGLGDDVPGITVDDEQVCSSCRAYDQVRGAAEQWFRTPADLRVRLDAARRRRRAGHDCLLLLSGGKDSTYALYQLVAQGWDVHALTLDNGYISEGAKENVRRTVADLGVTHEFATTDAMDEIFRDSLERYSNVCNGCYKTIYTLAVTRARALGIPVIVTGLSRGQFFETRLVPHQFEADHFDPDAIDAAVLEARKAYHRTEDAVTRNLDNSVFDDDAVFEEIEFVDFYRYVDVELSELYRFLDAHAPWVRPADTGRSTNCLVNAAGIYVHQVEQGFHNYALPYSWDVRLGHKTREEALAELDDQLDDAEVHTLLEQIGFEPRPREVLTAWYQAERELEPDALRQHLRARLPEHAIPAAFVRLSELPLAASAKTDVAALPAPTRFHRSGSGYTAPTTVLGARLCEIWGEVLGIERVGIDDDFFAIGGRSLDALEMVARIVDELGIDVPDTAAFQHRSVRGVEALLTAQRGTGPIGGSAAAAAPVGRPIRVPEPAIPRVEGVRLSSGQEGLLYEVLAEPESPRFAITRRYEVAGPFDPDRFRAALIAVIAAHEPLHWTVAGERRSVDPDEALEWQVLPEGTDVDGCTQSQARRRFDPARPPMVRATVIPGEPTALVLSLHHLWCDAGSFDVLWADLACAYRGDPLPERTVRYHDHAAWQQAQVDDGSRAYWRELLEPVEASPAIALRAPSTAEPDGYLRRRVELDRRGPSLLASLLASVDLVLSSYTDDPVVVGVPVTIRDHPAVASLVGYFLNEVVLPLPAARDADVGTLTEEVEALLATALRHRRVPYAHVLADRRRAGRTSDLLRVMVVHDAAEAPSLDGCTVRGETVPNGSAVTDLSLFVIERGPEVEVAVEWSGQRFGARDIEVLLARLVAVFEEGARRPDTTVGELQGRWVPDDLVGPSLPDEPVLVTDEIWARADRDDVAVSDGVRRATYRELLAGADRVAAQLVARGVRPGDSVALLLGRSIEQVTCMLGVLRARACYVPIDAGHPPARVADMLASAAPTAVITTDDLADRAEAWPRLSVADALAEPATSPPAPPSPHLAMPEHTDPAYLIHTSGSTGVPRGVRIGHRQLAASNRARRLHYDQNPARFLWTSSYGFDSSVAGLFWTLSTGGELVLAPVGTTDVDLLIERADSSRATNLLTVPSLWSAMLDRGAARLHQLRAVIVAGEPCPAELVSRHRRLLPDVELWNEYGPTEATVWATVHRCVGGEDPVPIGRPIADMVARVTDGHGAPRPMGLSGELRLGGPSVADGYVADPDATAERFEVDPDGTRWYRTGDVVRRRDDGVLEFLGRVDEQLNLHGVRIEPAEVERAVQAFDGVRAVVVRAEPRTPPDVIGALDALPAQEVAAMLRHAQGSGRPAVELAEQLARRLGSAPVLVAHVEAEQLDEVRLRALLHDRLAEHSVPARIVRHDRLPRSPHGKVDRNAVALAPGVASVSAPLGDDDVARAGEDGLAHRIAVIWRDLLADPGIGIDSDFFDTDADSLLAVKTVTVLSEALGVEVSVTALLEARTPRALAGVLRPEVERQRTLVPLQAGEEHGSPPVFFLAQYGGHAEAMLASYLPLVAGLDPWVTAIGVRQTEDATDEDGNIEGVARSTFRQIAAAHPDGPLWVLGSSVNGLIALEVARLWREAGREVAFVGLGDTFFPGEGDRYQRILIVRRARKYRALLRAGNLHQIGEELTDAVRSRLGRPPIDRGRHAPWTSRLRFERELRLSAQTYVPPRVRLPVVLYSASATVWSKAGRRWRDALPELTVVPVRGSHHGRRYFLRAERVGPVTTDLRRRLAAARQP